MALSPTRFYTYAYFRPDGRPLYIGKGQTKRWRDHFRQAQKIIAGGSWPKHGNPKFLRIIIKAIRAGIDVPIVKLQTDLTAEQAIRNEVVLIAAVGREANDGPLVNLTDGGEGMEGFVHSDESRQKQRTARLGKPMSAETKAKISATSKGRPKPTGFGDRISASLKGKPLSVERRAKISAARTGQKLSAEARANRIKVMASESLRARLREANLGKKATLETRAKMSATHTARWVQRRSM